MMFNGAVNPAKTQSRSMELAAEQIVVAETHPTRTEIWVKERNSIKTVPSDRDIGADESSRVKTFTEIRMNEPGEMHVSHPRTMQVLGHVNIPNGDVCIAGEKGRSHLFDPVRGRVDVVVGKQKDGRGRLGNGGIVADALASARLD